MRCDEFGIYIEDGSVWKENPFGQWQTFCCLFKSSTLVPRIIQSKKRVNKGLVGWNHSRRVEKVIVALFYGKKNLPAWMRHRLQSTISTDGPRSLQHFCSQKTVPLLPFVMSVWLSTPFMVECQSGPKYLVQPEKKKWLASVSIEKRALLPYCECQMPPTSGSIAAIWCKTNTMKSSIFPLFHFCFRNNSLSGFSGLSCM